MTSEPVKVPTKRGGDAPAALPEPLANLGDDKAALDYIAGTHAAWTARYPSTEGRGIGGSVYTG
jgi:hypothetical protein